MIWPASRLYRESEKHALLREAPKPFCILVWGGPGGGAVCPDGYTLLSRGQIFLWRPGWQRVGRLSSKALDWRGCDLQGRPSKLPPHTAHLPAQPQVLPDTEPTAPLGSGPGSKGQQPHRNPACMWYLGRFTLIGPLAPLVSRVCWSYNLKSNFPL